MRASSAQLFLLALSAGAPRLRATITAVLRATGEPPDFHVLRDSTAEDSPPRWSIAVQAGDVIEEVDLDIHAPGVAAPAAAAFLLGVVDDLHRELHEFVDEAEVLDGVVSLLRRRQPRRTTGKPS